MAGYLTFRYLRFSGSKRAAVIYLSYMSEERLGTREILSETPSEDAQLDRIAEKIRTLGIRDAAIFALEAHRPLLPLVGHLAQLVHTVVPSILSQQQIDLLSDRSSVEKLINKLEETA